jgi:hypothetical protein
MELNKNNENVHKGINFNNYEWNICGSENKRKQQCSKSLIYNYGSEKKNSKIEFFSKFTLIWSYKLKTLIKLCALVLTRQLEYVGVNNSK